MSLLLTVSPTILACSLQASVLQDFSSDSRSFRAPTLPLIPTGLARLRRLGSLLRHVQPRLPWIRGGVWRTVGPELEDLVLTGIVPRPFRQPPTIRVARLGEVGPVGVDGPGDRLVLGRRGGRGAS